MRHTESDWIGIEQGTPTCIRNPNHSVYEHFRKGRCGSSLLENSIISLLFLLLKNGLQLAGIFSYARPRFTPIGVVEYEDFRDSGRV